MNVVDLARRQMRLSRLEKKIKERKEQVRKEFFSIANQNTPDYTLPTTSIHVPEAFFNISGMSHTDFLKSRFPSWTLKATTISGKDVVFVLQKRPEYVGYVDGGPGVQISRSISELTPEIDWDIMKLVDPILFGMFAKEVVTYELDADLFQKVMADDPSFDAQGFLARYAKHKPPTLRVLAKELKDE